MAWQSENIPVCPVCHVFKSNHKVFSDFIQSVICLQGLSLSNLTFRFTRSRGPVHKTNISVSLKSTLEVFKIQTLTITKETVLNNGLVPYIILNSLFSKLQTVPH